MFFYYWVPVKKHIIFDNIDVILQKKVTKKIADIDKGLVDITLDIKDNLDINIDLLIDGKHKKFLLKKTAHNVNGFIIYECSSINKDDIQDIELLKIQAYHCFKDFFHIHEYHDAGNDALISAYVSDTSDKIKECLEHYYKLYTDKFDEFKRLVDLYPSSRVTKEFKKDSDITKASILISEAKRLILLARGEMIYADFLLSACIYEGLDDIYKEYKAHFEMYEKELNIYYDKYDTVYGLIDMTYSKQINRYQMYLGVLGIVIGIVSLIS